FRDMLVSFQLKTRQAVHSYRPIHTWLGVATRTHGRLDARLCPWHPHASSRPHLRVADINVWKHRGSADVWGKCARRQILPSGLAVPRDYHQTIWLRST